MKETNAATTTMQLAFSAMQHKYVTGIDKLEHLLVAVALRATNAALV
jgi:hypothetical protein